MDIENNLKYGISKGNFAARVCYPMVPFIEERCEPRVEDQYQSTYIFVDHKKHVIIYDLDQNMSEENLSQIMVIPHISEDEVNEKLYDTNGTEMQVISLATPGEKNIGPFSKDATRRVYLHSYGLDGFDSLYEGELKCCTSDEDNNDMQGFGDINSSS